MDLEIDVSDVISLDKLEGTLRLLVNRVNSQAACIKTLQQSVAQTASLERLHDLHHGMRNSLAALGKRVEAIEVAITVPPPPPSASNSCHAHGPGHAGIGACVAANRVALAAVQQELSHKAAASELCQATRQARASLEERSTQIIAQRGGKLMPQLLCGARTLLLHIIFCGSS